MVAKPKTISSILIANRGEIAVRIIKTVQEMGIRAIAVHSDVDVDALHVRLADEALSIGRAPAAQSYLSIENVIEAAKSSGADAIHPGYGFLSENAGFVRACADAGIIFIGPSVEAIEIMGNKARAKQRMQECGVGCVPGYDGADQGDAAFVKAAKDIGYPVMVKAAAGGGGRGMRLVENPADLSSALEQARGEALSGFGSDELILEKAITHARHIEFQVFGDAHGNIIHLGERDCSLQRRHQKVIEETPSPAVDDDLRQRMGDAAIKAAQSVSYEGAGTVEFLLDEDKNFYFLEMNTRLQVEHPVTEMVTGLDLVEWQILVARGGKLPLVQDEVKISGHAIEARLYAEDPANGFMPSTGRIEQWLLPADSDTRVDSGIESGCSISSHYDAMLAKIIVCSTTREAARCTLLGALHQTILLGPDHNKAFLIRLLENKRFAQGDATTGLIEKELAAGRLLEKDISQKIVAVAVVLDFLAQYEYQTGTTPFPTHVFQNWSSSPLPERRFKFASGEQVFDGNVRAMGRLSYLVICGDQEFTIEVEETRERRVAITTNNRSYMCEPAIRRDGSLFVAVDGKEFKFNDMIINARGSKGGSSDGNISAPMHGNLVEINVNTGDVVNSSTPVATLEAMKMRHEIVAGVAGVVKAVHFAPGAQVSAGDILFEIEEGSQHDAASA